MVTYLENVTDKDRYYNHKEYKYVEAERKDYSCHSGDIILVLANKKDTTSLFETESGHVMARNFNTSKALGYDLYSNQVVTLTGKRFTVAKKKKRKLSNTDSSSNKKKNQHKKINKNK